MFSYKCIAICPFSISIQIIFVFLVKQQNNSKTVRYNNKTANSKNLQNRSYLNIYHKNFEWMERGKETEKWFSMIWVKMQAFFWGSSVCFLLKKCWGTLKIRKEAQPLLMKKQDLYSKESSTNNFIHTWQILSNKFKKTNPCS